MHKQAERTPTLAQPVDKNKHADPDTPATGDNLQHHRCTFGRFEKFATADHWTSQDHTNTQHKELLSLLVPVATIIGLGQENRLLSLSHVDKLMHVVAVHLLLPCFWQRLPSWVTWPSLTFDTSLDVVTICILMVVLAQVLVKVLVGSDVKSQSKLTFGGIF